MDQPSLEQFRASLRGELIQSGDPGYDDARKVYNGMIDKHPRLIVRCVDTADVIYAINFARENGLLVAIRGGGHNGGGLGTCDDGLVIDLSRMKGVHVDPVAGEARVQGGCVWGDVDHATHAFGMAVPCGFISTTGVGGLTLGGGIGYLTRTYGLTIDNLLSADVVLADGRLVKASAKENPDLFWALRGGGGNFGVVTSFLFRLQPVKTVYAGPTFWPLEQAADVLRAYREFIVQAPEDINGFFAFLVVPPAPMFPEHLHLQEDVRDRVVLHGAARESGGGTEAHAEFRQAGVRPRRPISFPNTPELVRRALSARPAVVLASGLREGDQR